MSAVRTKLAAFRWLGLPTLAALNVIVPALLLVLSAVGLGIGGYLSYTHWADKVVACGGLGDCEVVQNSDYATLGPVPVALLGVLAYAGMGSLALLTLWRRSPALEWPILVFWAAALAGTAYSAYLTYVELFVLEAICVWCVASAVVVTVSLLVSTAYIVALESTLAPEDAEPEDTA